MKFFKKQFFIVFLISFIGCTQNKNNFGSPIKMEVVLKSFVKTQPLTQEFCNLTKINKKYITSAFYLTIDNKEYIEVFINDKLFNYDYFNQKIYPNIENRKVVLYVKKYLIKNKTVFIAEKIEL